MCAPDGDSAPAPRLLSLMRALMPRQLAEWLRGLRRLRARFRRMRRVATIPLESVEPTSRVFGLDRGLPIDRCYIEEFLARHSDDVRGRVLEIGDDAYTRKFGGSRVERCDVLHVRPGNPRATIVADLSRAEHLPGEMFDCMVLTQTLQFIYDVRSAVRHCHRMLRPGGVLLATFPGISQISRYDMERWGDFWRFTSLSARRVFEEFFPPGNLTIESRGNALAAVAFLHGLAAEELKPELLAHRDPDYEVLITVRAVKPTQPD